VTGTPLWWVAPVTGAPSLDTIEQVARRLHEQEGSRSSFRCISWEELSEDERDDVRHLVRSVLDVLENQMPGLVAQLPPPIWPLATEPTYDAATDPEQGPWSLTGT
jgi:hypothetical protein